GDSGTGGSCLVASQGRWLQHRRARARAAPPSTATHRVQVTVLNHRETLLKDEGPEVVAALESVLEGDGITLLHRASLRGLTDGADGEAQASADPAADGAADTEGSRSADAATDPRARPRRLGRARTAQRTPRPGPTPPPRDERSAGRSGPVGRGAPAARGALVGRRSVAGGGAGDELAQVLGEREAARLVAVHHVPCLVVLHPDPLGVVLARDRELGEDV